MPAQDIALEPNMTILHMRDERERIFRLLLNRDSSGIIDALGFFDLNATRALHLNQGGLIGRIFLVTADVASIAACITSEKDLIAILYWRALVAEAFPQVTGADAFRHDG